MSTPGIHILIAAAGQGNRFGGTVLKQYLTIRGKPALAHTIDALKGCPRTTGMTVVIGEQDHMFDELIRPHYPNIKTVIGGDSRAESVLNGLEGIREHDPEAQWVLVHDAARPCVTTENVLRLIREALAHPDGGLLAIPVRDTLKQAGEDDCVEHTMQRDRVWAAQTPQLFPLERLATALVSMMSQGEQPTDEAAAMQFMGARPKLVRGSLSNIKLTWPEDLRLAEAWFERNQKGGGGT